LRSIACELTIGFANYASTPFQDSARGFWNAIEGLLGAIVENDAAFRNGVGRVSRFDGKEGQRPVAGGIF